MVATSISREINLLKERQPFEQEAFKRLRKLNAKHRAEIQKYLGTPPNVENVPQSFWDRVEKEQAEELALFLLLVFMMSGDLNGMPDGLSSMLGSAWARKRSKWTARKMGQTTAKRMATAQARWDAKSSPVQPDEVLADLESILGDSRAANVATTEVTKALTAGVLAAAGAKDGKPGSGDDGTVPDDVQIIWRLGNCKHCLIPGQWVESLGPLVGASKRFYSGNVIELRLASGRSLTVTPNHPILTAAGLVAAGDLREGSNVLRCTDGKRMLSSSGLRDEDYDDTPALVENVFESLKMAGLVLSEGVPATSEDFHGDGVGGDGYVDIVRSASRLEFDKAMVLGERICEECGKFDLFGGRLRKPVLSRGGDSGNFLGTWQSSESGPFFGSHSVSACFSGIFNATNVDARLYEGAVQHLSGGSNFVGEGEDWLSGIVSGNQSGNAWELYSSSFSGSGATANFDSGFHEGALESVSRGSDFLRERPEGDPGQIPLYQLRQIISSDFCRQDVVASVRVFEYSGPVYNLEVEGTHLYLTDTIMTGNCKFCPTMAGTDIRYWSQFTDGPPAHNFCCCYTVVHRGGTTVVTSGRNPDPFDSTIKSGIFAKESHRKIFLPQAWDWEPGAGVYKPESVRATTRAITARYPDTYPDIVSGYSRSGQNPDVSGHADSDAVGVSSGKLWGTVEKWTVTGNLRTSGVSEMSDQWTRYTGPRGGRGWRNTTGDIVYQDQKPGDGGAKQEASVDMKTRMLRADLDPLDSQTLDAIRKQHNDTGTRRTAKKLLKERGESIVGPGKVEGSARKPPSGHVAADPQQESNAFEAIDYLGQELKNRGAKRLHQSASGSEYFELPDGRTVRVSDHTIPQNEWRDFTGSDKRWDEDIVFSGRTEPAKAVAAAIDRLFVDSETGQLIKWASKSFKTPGHAKAFTEWFGDSVVTDESGEPLRVYHGTIRRFDDPDEFEVTKGEMGVHFGTAQVAGMFAKPLGAYIEEPRMYPVFLSIKKPLRLQDNGTWGWDSLRQKPEEFTDEKLLAAHKAGKTPLDVAKEAGYDGIVYLNRREIGIPGGDLKAFADRLGSSDNNVINKLSDAEFKEKFPEATLSYIAFSPEQIKSATGNSGEFDPKKRKINESRLTADHAANVGW